MNLAPIALFAYNRPEHLAATLEALRANVLAAQSRLHIFSDGPKKPEAAVAVREVRRLLEKVEGFGEVQVVERASNFGLAASVIDGVTQLTEAHGRVIVIEDDLIVSPYFLEYMNAALERYRDEPSVKQVSGYMFPVDMRAQEDSLFLPFTTSWGWATWARAWQEFDPAMRGLQVLDRDRHLRRAFNLDGNYDYYGMLQRQARGEVDSWAIRWYLSVFLKQGLTLYPARTLVTNAGFDGSGTHCGAGDFGQAGGRPDFRVRTFPPRAALAPGWKRVLEGMPKRRLRPGELARALAGRIQRAWATRNGSRT